MRIGAERLNPVRAVLDGPADQAGDRRRRDLVVVDVDLEPEPAPDIGTDHPDPVIVDPEKRGVDLLHLVGRLVGLVDDERSVGGPVIRDRHPRLQRDGGMAPEAERVLDRCIGRGEGSVDLADVEPVGESEIVAERGMDRARGGVQRFGRVRDGIERFVVDDHQVRRVLRRRAALGHHGRDGLALPERRALRHGGLGRGFVPRAVRGDGNHRFANPGEIRSDDDTEHAGPAGRLVAVDAEKAGMRVRTSHEGGVQHSRQHDVVGVTAAPVGEATSGDAGRGPADRTAFENGFSQTLLRRRFRPPSRPSSHGWPGASTRRRRPMDGTYWRALPAPP